MKKIYNYTFQLVCVYIFVLTLFSVFNIEIKTNNYVKTVYNNEKEKFVDSTLLVQSHLEDEGVEEESINEELVVEKEVPVVEEKPSENIVLVDTSQYTVLSSEVITMSRYGHDCYGCYGGQTAAGYYVGDGRLYYEDSTFGSLRIVAADKKYPLGTVIRLSNDKESFNAIVLDRGGGIGDGKRFQIDLLEPSEAVANSMTIGYNTLLEVLRLGY